jgi:acetate kinase
LALDMFVYRVRKYIGAYTAALGGRVDALIFSAGIGENSSIIRGMICEDFKVCMSDWWLRPAVLWGLWHVLTPSLKPTGVR